MNDGDTVNNNCILVIRTSPWIWPEYQPKHVGENIINKIYHGILKSILLVICICFDIKFPLFFSFFPYLTVPFYQSFIIFNLNKLAQSVMRITFIQSVPCHSWLLHEVYFVRIFRCISLSVLTNVEIVSQIIWQVLLFTTFKMHYYLTSLKWEATNLAVLNTGSECTKQ